MNIWPTNTEKIITIIAKDTATINVYSRLKNTDDPYAALPGTVTYRGNDTWELPAIFGIGEYIIKILITDNNYTLPIYTDLIVVTAEEYNLTINQEVIKTDITALSNKIDTENSWKAIG